MSADTKKFLRRKTVGTARTIRASAGRRGEARRLPLWQCVAALRTSRRQMRAERRDEERRVTEQVRQFHAPGPRGWFLRKRAWWRRWWSQTLSGFRVWRARRG